jgi:hypothetical protein
VEGTSTHLGLGEPHLEDLDDSVLKVHRDGGGLLVIPAIPVHLPQDRIHQQLVSILELVDEQGPTARDGLPSGKLAHNNTPYTCNQCFGSGSAWIRIKFVSWIRIRIPNADPDPAADNISSKSQNNLFISFSYLTNFNIFFFLLL